MKDQTLLRGILLGSSATLLLILLVAMFGHLPRQSEPRHNCLCPDSTVLEQPRSLEPKPRN